ncbi:hypothetical protein [Bosea vaviloviae]|uniref:hypothetical protein n=1 Tax=Bosea vaviloviae TaxID=1526658 RepID=UPI0013146359|nr:hypothetical protein [Bosea vaviloviae]
MTADDIHACRGTEMTTFGNQSIIAFGNGAFRRTRVWAEHLSTRSRLSNCRVSGVTYSVILQSRTAAQLRCMMP